MDTFWTPGGRLSRKERLLLWTLPTVVFLVLAILRWERLGDLQVDFGQDIAAAWAITEGKHLYTDIAYFKGPLSPHWNALLMTIFGVSIRTITIANSLIALAISYGILQLARRICGRAVASTLACIFLLMFAFSVDREMAIYNFVSPFVHELTHGVALSLATFLCIDSWERNRRSWMLALGGICFGLVWLTRLEVAVALSAACAVWSLLLWREDMPLAHLLKHAAIFGTGMLTVIIIAVAALAQTMPWPTAFRSTFASVDATLNTSVASSPFFLMVGGWDRPLYSIVFQVVIFMVIALWMYFAYTAADLWRCGAKGFAVCMGAVEIMMALKLAERLLPFVHGGALTLLMIIIMTGALRIWLHGPVTARPKAHFTFIVGTFSLLMLGKIFLAPNIRFYGFAHAMPAYLLLIGVLLTATPSIVMKRLEKQGTTCFMVLLTLTILIDIGGKARIDQILAMRKTLSFGSGADHFLIADIRSNIYFQQFLQAAPALIPAGSTLTAIPEGAMINYLLRLPLGVPVMNYMRTEYFIFGKERIEGDLFARRPDFIVVTHKETSDFGIPLYGKMPEYGADVIVWLKKEYEQIALFGQEPLTAPKSEGVALWRRKMK